MSRKAFLTAEDGATVKFNFALSKAWKVTLGGNRTLAFVNVEKGDEITVMLVQDSTGGRSVVWPSSVKWAAGASPSLQTAVGAVDVITLTYDGTNFRELSGGGGARLPTRLVAIGLATIAVIGTGSGMVGARLNLSRGSGEGIGNLPRAIEIRSKSGAELNSLVNGTGSVLVGSGILAVGTVEDKGVGATFLVANNGATTIKQTMSAATLKMNVPSAGSYKVACYQTGGQLSYCQATPDANGCACK